ncbi:PEGA domain-containing protein [Rubrivirga sp. IMCC45206]|uniref:PEGA domain-containing protein n=1 Tax=Rubrivirga sp. IMCC45206 TaxID=3391614 RepID=UPI00398FD9C7
MPAFARLALVALLVATSGCATIIQGSRQDVLVDTDPSGARVTVNGYEAGETPVILDLKRDEHHHVELALEGYEPVVFRLERDLDFVPAVVGNVFSFGLLGFAVDFVSGAAYELSPDELLATLQAEGVTVAPSDDPSQIRVVLLPAEAVEAALAAR